MMNSLSSASRTMAEVSSLQPSSSPKTSCLKSVTMKRTTRPLRRVSFSPNGPEIRLFVDHAARTKTKAVILTTPSGVPNPLLSLLEDEKTTAAPLPSNPVVPITVDDENDHSKSQDQLKTLVPLLPSYTSLMQGTKKKPLPPSKLTLALLANTKDPSTLLANIKDASTRRRRASFLPLRSGSPSKKKQRRALATVVPSLPANAQGNTVPAWCLDSCTFPFWDNCENKEYYAMFDPLLFLPPSPSPSPRSSN